MVVIMLLLTVAAPAFAADKDRDKDRRWFPMWGLRYDSVQGASIAGSICFMRELPGRARCSHEFWIGQLAAGEGGGKIQIGVGEWWLAGESLKVSAMQTWGDPIGVEPDQTYLGIEYQKSILLMNGYIGAYAHVAGDDNEREALFTWGLGWGF